MKRANPKSEILNDVSGSSGDFINKFSGFISRWTIFIPWQYLIASIIGIIASLESVSGNYSHSSILSNNSPPCMSSMTKHICASSSKTSYNLIMLGWSIYFIISISIYKASKSSYVIFLFDNTFIA